MNRCWILIGMMGAGKSSIGRELADLTQRTFIDTDVLLQQRFGRSIAQIFQIYGEDAFREHEASVLRSLTPSLTVISTGGGIVLRNENWVEFQRLGHTVFLDAKAETLVERLASSKKKRPLLNSEDWEDRIKMILESRIALYRQADVTVKVDDVDLSDGAERVLKAIQEFDSHAN